VERAGERSGAAFDQVLNTLLAGQWMWSADAATGCGTAGVFIYCPDGTGIADFRKRCAFKCPQGLLANRWRWIPSRETLEANVPQCGAENPDQGQEVETLAGHLDLTGTFRGATTGCFPVKPAVSAASTEKAPLLRPVAAPASYTSESARQTGAAASQAVE